MPHRATLVNYDSSGDASVNPFQVQQPVCLRCMVIQDRNYTDGLDLNAMIRNLFGVTIDTVDLTG